MFLLSLVFIRCILCPSALSALSYDKAEFTQSPVPVRQFKASFQALNVFKKYYRLHTALSVNKLNILVLN